MDDKRHVYLVPGLFGFAEIGSLSFFAHVREHLTAALGALELEAEIHAVETTPTASVTARVVKLVEAIHAGPAAAEGEIHLVGHSTGGLDARLLATPDVSLRTELETREIARRIRTVTTIATPHHGTPLAGYFSSPYGRQLVKLLTVMTAHVLDSGRLPVEPLLELGQTLVGLDHGVEIEEAAIEAAHEQLLGGLSDELRSGTRELADQVDADQALFDQLIPAGIDLFNATAVDRDAIRYGAVVAAAPQPALKPVGKTGLDPFAQASHGLFATLHRIAGSGATADYRGQLSGEQAERLQRAYGSTPSVRENDGVVPTLSQLWGKLIHTARADHLDVLGHFHDPASDPPHHDWLASGARFDRPAFERLWNDVARFIADDEGEAA